MCAPDMIDSPTASTASCTRRGRDHLGRLVQAGVDDLVAGVGERARDDLGAAVVAVEPGLGDEDAELAIGVMIALALDLTMVCAR